MPAEMLKLLLQIPLVLLWWTVVGVAIWGVWVYAKDWLR